MLDYFITFLSKFFNTNKIYKIYQIVNYIGYDSAIVVAESEDAAKNIHPCGKILNWNNLSQSDYILLETWAQEKSDIHVEYIGIGEPYFIENQVLLASFTKYDIDTCCESPSTLSEHSFDSEQECERDCNSLCSCHYNYTGRCNYKQMHVSKKELESDLDNICKKHVRFSV